MKKYFSNLGFTLSLFVNSIFGGPLHYTVCASAHERWILFQECRWAIRVLDFFGGRGHCHKSWTYCSSVARKAKWYG